MIDISKAEANWTFFFFFFLVAKFSVAFAQEKLEINLIVGYELLCKKKKERVKKQFPRSVNDLFIASFVRN